MTSKKIYASPDVIRQIGEMTRKLHNSVVEMGLMPDLQAAAQALPDARSRLHYISKKTTDAANRVLNSVDEAKLEHERINANAMNLAQILAYSEGIDPELNRELQSVIQKMQLSTQRIDEQLTNIMLAQDFHDLTGQIVSKVLRLTEDLECNLVKLLLQVSPDFEVLPVVKEEDLHGPVVDPEKRTDVVSGQSDVDDLLAQMGF